MFAGGGPNRWTAQRVAGELTPKIRCSRASRLLDRVGCCGFSESDAAVFEKKKLWKNKKSISSEHHPTVRSAAGSPFHFRSRNYGKGIPKFKFKFESYIFCVKKPSSTFLKPAMIWDISLNAKEFVNSALATISGWILTGIGTGNPIVWSFENTNIPSSLIVLNLFPRLPRPVLAVNFYLVYINTKVVNS